MASSDSSLSEKQYNEKHDDIHLSTREVDTAAELAAGDDGPLDPVEANIVR